MILNRDTAHLLRTNGKRLAKELGSKKSLEEFALADTFTEMLTAIENLLTTTSFYFDDEILNLLSPETWRELKALLMIFANNELNNRESQMSFHNHERIVDGASLEP